MIRVSRLTKDYGQRRAIDNLTFEAEQGEILGFLGPNGAGKTTAFNLISDLTMELTGSPAGEEHSNATTDLRAFVHYGKGQATCYGPEGENMHAEDERLNIESMIRTAKLYALFLARWCRAVE